MQLRTQANEVEISGEVNGGVNWIWLYHDDASFAGGARLRLVFYFQLLQSLYEGKAFVELAFGLFLYRFLRR